MKQFLLSVSLLIGTGFYAQDCSELFISEYVEGWSNNKAIEIYNPTNQSIDLSQYILVRYSNGSTSAGAQQSVQLAGTVAPYDVYVAVIDKRDPNGTGQEAPVWDSLQAKADGFYCPDYNTSNAMYFNGNDVVVLAKGTYTNPTNAQAIDIFGKIGEDPDNGQCDPSISTCGWTTEFPYVAPAGVVVTTDHSLIRKSTVLKGVTDPTISFFNPLGEWDSIPPVVFDQQLGYLVGNWESLGSHECNCDPGSGLDSESAQKISIYPNPSEDGVFTVSANGIIEELTVYNSVGQVVFAKKDLNAVSQVNLGDKTGVYLINIRTKEGQVASRRVIIK
ncbi:MAG: lamin tail domain-containing protein [Brumimicrobium sp.]|nr:lamin tail domain-containing protein [Brumimicrobium sp.]